jgi:hypothetical protein
MQLYLKAASHIIKATFLILNDSTVIGYYCKPSIINIGFIGFIFEKLTRSMNTQHEKESLHLKLL